MLEIDTFVAAFYLTCPSRGIEVNLLYDVKAKYNGWSTIDPIFLHLMRYLSERF
jgi:hypothetical protein